MLYGEQWKCGCGWSNFFERAVCRHCGEEKPENASTEDCLEVIDRVYEESATDGAGAET